MATIKKSTFTKTLGQDGGRIDTHRMSPELKKSLKKNGVKEADLKKIAGQDGIIRGKKELKQLFKVVDGFDQNGSRSSIATEKGGTSTKAGELYKALKGETDRSREAAAKRGGLRFAGDKTLDKVADGKKILKRGSKGEGVKKVQQSLIDMGYKLEKGATGTYDKDTARAVSQFQAETGIGKDGKVGKVGKETLGALKQTAPAPGKKLVRSAEYDKLYADGRLDMTVAVGFDEDGAHKSETRDVLKGFKKDGYKPVDVSKLTDAEKTKLGLTKDRFDPNAQYFHKSFKDPKTGKDIDSVIRLITPDSGGKTARDSFKKAMEQDEVVLYNGHARYGTGPDFDHKYKGEGNFVIDEKGNKKHDKPPAKLKKSIKGRGSDLDELKTKPKYQLLIMNGCSTEEYHHNLRNGDKFEGRDQGNTDIIGTTQPTWVGTGAEHTLQFVNDVTNRRSNREMLDKHDRIEMDYSKSIGEDPKDGQHAYMSDGFLRNKENREVPK